MKQNKSFKKLEDVGEENITKEIKNRVSRNEWILIGGIKSWVRQCNHCGNLVCHTNHTGYSSSVRFNKKCEQCRQPTGKNNSFYGKKFSKNQIEKWKKERTGSGNPMYGTVGGMWGKKHTTEAIKKQSKKAKIRWRRWGHIQLSKFAKYRNKVTRLTERQPIHLLPNHEKRGVAGKNGAFHLDHIKSVWYGFKNKIKPEKISHISNLRFIPWLENQQKWYK